MSPARYWEQLSVVTTERIYLSPFTKDNKQADCHRSLECLSIRVVTNLGLCSIFFGVSTPIFFKSKEWLLARVEAPPPRTNLDLSCILPPTKMGTQITALARGLGGGTTSFALIDSMSFTLPEYSPWQLPAHHLPTRLQSIPDSATAVNRRSSAGCYIKPAKTPFSSSTLNGSQYFSQFILD